MAIKGARLRIAAAGAIALIALQCSKAIAQQASVPDAQGIAVGGFRLYPDLRLTAAFDDNVFLSTLDPRTDTVELITPSVALRSNWSVHDLELNATSTLRRYNRNPEQNTDEYQGGASGRLDVDATMPVSGSIQAGHLAEVLGTPGTDNAFGRYRQFDFIEASAGINKRLNRVTIGINGTARNARYDPIKADGETIDQSAIDRNNRSVSGQIQYAYSSITAPYVAAVYSTVKYVHPGQLPPRDSKGISILFGTTFEITRLFYGKIAVGYLKQKFDNAAYPDFSGLNYEADITYKPTALDTLHFNAARSIVASGLIGVPGVLQSNFALGEVHQLTSRTTINLDLLYNHEVYRGVDRQQDRYTASIAARRTLNRYLALSLSYRFLKQTSAGLGSGLNYTGNRVSVTLIAFK